MCDVLTTNTTAVHPVAVHTIAVHTIAVHTTAVHTTAVHTTAVHTTAVHPSLVYPIVKGVFKGGVQGVQTNPEIFRFFLKSEGKEIESKRKKGMLGGGGYLLTYFWG